MTNNLGIMGPTHSLALAEGTETDAASLLLTRHHLVAYLCRSVSTIVAMTILIPFLPIFPQ